MRLTHERMNGIKSGFWSPCRKTELVDQLAKFENLGYSPEDLALILDAIVPDAILKAKKEER